MANLRLTSLNSTSRLLIAGAAFIFVVLAAAAAVTNGAGLDVRADLTSASTPANQRLATGTEIERLLGRGGFAGLLMAYANDQDLTNIDGLEQILNEASAQADGFADLGMTNSSQQFLDTVRGRIAQGRLALASISSGVRTPEVVTLDFTADLAAFDESFASYRMEEQRAQTLNALGVLDLQRWITSLALAAAVFIMGAGAIALHMNVRRPIRQLAENLEDLLTGDEDRILREADRPDEIGNLARIAEQLRRTQLQAGRLLSFGPDGTLRLRLEGENAVAVDDALLDLSDAADTARASAAALVASGDELVTGGQDAVDRIECVLTKSVEEASGRLSSLSKAGEEVLCLAEGLEDARTTMTEGLEDTRATLTAGLDEAREHMGSVEAEWRTEMSNWQDQTTGLTQTIQTELDKLRINSTRLAVVAEDVSGRVEQAGARADKAGDQIAVSAANWANEQAALNKISSSTRENLAARLVSLDAKIGLLDDTLEHLEDLTSHAVPPIEHAASIIGDTVRGLSFASDSAAAASAHLSKEAAASRNAREAIISELEEDRSEWLKARGEIQNQAVETINLLGETAAQVDGLANDLAGSSAEIPARMGQLSTNMSGLSNQITALEQTGATLSTQFGERIGTMQQVMEDTRSSIVDEAGSLRSVTSGLKDLHLTFENESRRVGEQIGAVSGTLENLDEHLVAINERVAAPTDLSPVLSALKTEMGQAVGHLTQVVEGQGLNTQQALEANKDAQAQDVAAHFAEMSSALEQAFNENGKNQRAAIAASAVELSNRFGTAIEKSNQEQAQQISQSVDGGLVDLSIGLKSAFIENSGQQSQLLVEGLSILTTTFDDAINESNQAQQQIIATGLSELSVTLNGKITEQGIAAQSLAETLALLDGRLNDLTAAQDQTGQEMRDALHESATASIKTSDVIALVEPRLAALNDTAHAMGEELRALAGEFANRQDNLQANHQADASPQVLDHIARVELLQTGLADAQQSIALSLRDGLMGIAQRLKTTDVSAISKQLGGVITSLEQQQDRFAETMLDMSTDMSVRIDELAGEIARIKRPTTTAAPRPGIKPATRALEETSIAPGRALNTRQPHAKAPTVAPKEPAAAPKENDLSAIYNALRGLTEDLKDISAEDTDAMVARVLNADLKVG